MLEDKMSGGITGVTETALKKISVEDGQVLHILKDDHEQYYGFGEAYISEVNPGCVKGWKNHTEMVANLTVLYGMVKFVVYDDRIGSDSRGEFSVHVISKDHNYSRLTIMPGLWFAFQGLGSSVSGVLNIASIKHDPKEGLSKGIAEISYDWSE